MFAACYFVGWKDTKIEKNLDNTEDNNMLEFEMNMEDFTIILNALHYYKKVEKRGNFAKFDEQRINDLRDRMSKQVTNYFG